jgi:hypothetical protein
MHAIAAFLQRSVDAIKEEFHWDERELVDGKRWPPSVNEIIDYFMSIGCSLTPIWKEPKYEHNGQVIEETRLPPDRWHRYTHGYEGLLVGPCDDVWHMTYNDYGTVHDVNGKTYKIEESEEYGFKPEIFLVAAWQS